MRTLRLCNRGANPFSVVIEPWGEAVSLAPGESCEVCFSGAEGTPEIEVGSDSSVAIFGWTGAFLDSVKKL
jgi:hypothetical protein